MLAWRVSSTCLLVLFSVSVGLAGGHADAAPGSSAQGSIARLESTLSRHRIQGRTYAALRVAQKILAAQRDRHGDDHAETIRAMKNVASLHALIGDYGRATVLSEEVAHLLEKKRGQGHVDTVSAIETLAGHYWAQRDFTRARRLYRRAIALQKRHWGGRSDLYIGGLQRYAAFLASAHRYSAAEGFYTKARKLLAARLGGSHPRVARAWLELGFVYHAQGDRERAERAFDRVLRVYQDNRENDRSDDWRLINALCWIAYAYQEWGEHDHADVLLARVERAYRAALHAHENARPRDLSLIVHATRKLARLLKQRGKWNEAEKLYARLLAAAERSVGEKSSQLVGDLCEWADVQRAQGKYRAAIRRLRRAERIYDEQHYRGWARSMPTVQLARVYRDMGKYARARELGEVVLARALETFGDGHPMVNQQREFLALLDLAQGKSKRALDQLVLAYEAEKKHIALILSGGTEADNRSHLAQRSRQLNVAIALHAQYLPQNRAATRLGLSMVLAHKGRLLDVAANSLAPLRRRMNQKDRQLLDELSSTWAQLSKLVLAGPRVTGEDDYARELAGLELRARSLERKVRSRSAAFRAKDRPISLAELRKSIPHRAALVEIVAYRQIVPGSDGAVEIGNTRYGAYVIKASGAPVWQDLGPSKPIDRRVARLRQALSSPDREDAAQWGRAVHDVVFAPLKRALGRSRHVLVAPDGELNLVPFAALVDRAGHYLIRRYNFTYLTSGRDLLRFGHQMTRLPDRSAPHDATSHSSPGHPDAKSRAAPGMVIVADPDFDRSSEATIGGGRREGRLQRFSSPRWERLPGTGREARALVEHFDDALLLSGRNATEQAIKKLRAPRILHLATHGFFLAERKSYMGTSHLARPLFEGRVSADFGPENPLLRSGLVLAGANQLSSGREDGVLTALEASGLDLWGTKLVVLSACETGVGAVDAGQGVYGLRRALAIAGAESLVMSLWQVDDEATRRLMAGYYKRLDAGRGRTGALRVTQLELLDSDEYSHPYYWAGFIPSGQWAPLPGM
ncbi:MAG: CHAT domain-containing protein [Proteobacteria bacterium]|nr:CHAT domain-containing protein [Pseudomonadota bacterium]